MKMIIQQHRIYRQDLKNNPTIMFLFGDNLLRSGFGGQAAAMRGEPNAVGIATKCSPSVDEGAFFSDDDYEANVQSILDDVMPVMRHIVKGGIVIIPSDGLGTGLSELETRAPKTNKALTDTIDYLFDLDRRYTDEDDTDSIRNDASGLMVSTIGYESS